MWRFLGLGCEAVLLGGAFGFRCKCWRGGERRADCVDVVRRVKFEDGILAELPVSVKEAIAA